MDTGRERKGNFSKCKSSEVEAGPDCFKKQSGWISGESKRGKVKDEVREDGGGLGHIVAYRSQE